MTHIIQIGNSYGIRIPKAIIQQLGLQDSNLLLKITEEGLLIVPEKKARKGWEEQFKFKVKKKKSPLLDEFPNDFDKDEWQW